MHGRGNERPGVLARCIYAMIVVLPVASVAFAIYALRREPAPVRGSQTLPAQAAEQAGSAPTPAARPE